MILGMVGVEGGGFLLKLNVGLVSDMIPLGPHVVAIPLLGE